MCSTDIFIKTHDALLFWNLNKPNLYCTDFPSFSQHKYVALSLEQL